MKKDNTIFNTDNTHSLMFVEKKLGIIWALKHFFFRDIVHRYTTHFYILTSAVRVHVLYIQLELKSNFK